MHLQGFALKSTCFQKRHDQNRKQKRLAHVLEELLQGRQNPYTFFVELVMHFELFALGVIPPIQYQATRGWFLRATCCCAVSQGNLLRCWCLHRLQ